MSTTDHGDDPSIISNGDHEQRPAPTQRNRLPALFEVLNRMTQSPVDLFSFYVYMRDQQRSVDYLDFWLDVSQHMALCRHYVRELRRSVLFETPDANADNATGGGSKSKRSSQILHDFEPPPGGGKSGSIRSGRSQDQRLSAFLRQESASNHKDSGSQHGSAHKDSSESRGDSVGERTPGTPGQQSGMSATLGRSKSRDTTPAGGLEQPRPSFMTSNLGDGSSPSGNHSSPHHTVNRSDIRASAEKILYVYVLPGSEREIVLPQNILDEIVDSIETQGRDDPEVFDAAKEYVFQAMEKDAFPGFLLAKAFGNLVPPSLMIRLIIGILSMFGAWWAAFSVLFLDKDRLTRLWLILPFTLGIYFLSCHQYTLDPILALAGYSEITFCSFVKVREPFVRRLFVKRALTGLGLVVVVTAAWVVLFVFVPGKRL